MRKVLGYVESAIALVIALFFLLMGIGLFWISFPPDEFGMYVTLFISVAFVIVGALGVLKPGNVSIGSRSRNRRNSRNR